MPAPWPLAEPAPPVEAPPVGAPLPPVLPPPAYWGTQLQIAPSQVHTRGLLMLEVRSQT